jgi:hypothetical protein
MMRSSEFALLAKQAILEYDFFCLAKLPAFCMLLAQVVAIRCLSRLQLRDVMIDFLTI